MKSYHTALCFFLLLPCAALAEVTAPDTGYGSNPVLPKPEKSLLPTLNIASAKGWPNGGKPVAAKGFAVAEFAGGLDHPRWLYVLPNGDVLVAETNKPARTDGGGGIKGAAMKVVMHKAGAGTESADRITLLRDANRDGVAETKSTFLSDLHSPFGMALIGDQFYVANTDAVMRFPYKDGDRSISAPGVKLADLPAGERNHHWTKSMVASKDGRKLYVGVGSNSNVAENGIEAEENRAAILEIDVADGRTRLFASGLRNPVGMDFNPVTGDLWVAVNERDELGDNLVPDYITSVKDGAFYGWPYSYYGQNVDERVQPPRPDLVAKAIAPDYAVGSHTASLGLAFYTGNIFPARYSNGAFIGQHGSWNRKTKSGYKVVFIPFADGKPDGMPEDVLTGFLDSGDNAMGRPVGVTVARDGALLVADDVGNNIWRIVPATPE